MLGFNSSFIFSYLRSSLESLRREKETAFQKIKTVLGDSPEELEQINKVLKVEDENRLRALYVLVFVNP